MIGTILLGIWMLLIVLDLWGIRKRLDKLEAESEDRCIHDEVCGLEDSHEEATTFCAHMIPKDVLGKIRAEIIEKFGESECAEECGCLYELLEIIDKYKGESDPV